MASGLLTLMTCADSSGRGAFCSFAVRNLSCQQERHLAFVQLLPVLPLLLLFITLSKPTIFHNQVHINQHFYAAVNSAIVTCTCSNYFHIQFFSIARRCYFVSIRSKILNNRHYLENFHVSCKFAYNVYFVYLYV